LFTVEAGDYAAATPFRIKMLVIGLAAVSALAIDWRVPTWDRASTMPVTARLVALISIVLWLGTILMGVEIPALTGWASAACMTPCSPVAGGWRTPPGALQFGVRHGCIRSRCGSILLASPCGWRPALPWICVSWVLVHAD